MYVLQQSRGQGSPSGLGLVCCIALQEHLHNHRWRSQFMATFEKVVAPIATLWYPPHEWDGPQNYQHEMGGPLSNLVVVLAKRVTLRDVVTLKRHAVEIEEKFRTRSGREVNVNPGFLAADGLVLASHKPSPLRRQLANDVFLERQQVLVPGRGLVPLPNAFSEFLLAERRGLLAALCGEGGRRPLMDSQWTTLGTCLGQERWDPPPNKPLKLTAPRAAA